MFTKLGELDNYAITNQASRPVKTIEAMMSAIIWLMIAICF